MNAGVAIITRVPRLGASKTRLAAALGEGAALALHEAFLEDELAQLYRPEAWSLYAVHDPLPDPEDPGLERLLAGRARTCVPGGASLAEDLRGAFEALLATHDRAVIVSADVPQLTADIVADALARLDEADLVLGPGPDGGYYLVGMRAPHDLFTPVEMSTSTVVAATELLARQRGLTTARVAPLTDMDEAQDLLALAHAPAGSCARTKVVIDGLERRVVAPGLPRDLQVEVTNRCNLRCQCCLRTFEELATPRDLTVEDFRRVLAGLPRQSRITFQLNGEPLLCADLPAMVREASAQGTACVMNTNGVLLDAQRRGALLDAGLEEARISLLGGTAATHDRLAGAPVFDRVVANLEALVRQRGERPRPRIAIWTVAHERTIAELAERVRLAARVGADEVYLQRLVVTGQGSAVGAQSLHGRADEPAIRRALEEADVEARRLGVALRASGRAPPRQSLTRQEGENPWLACWRPWRSAVVTAHLDVLPCCIASFRLPYDDLRLGNLGDDDWATIWNGERARALRRGILRAAPTGFCRGCTTEWSL